jgi:TonB family protein
MGSDETNLQPETTPATADSEDKQRRRMLVALALLVVALIVVLIKDRQYWFSSAPAPDSTATDEATPPPTAAPAAVPQSSPGSASQQVTQPAPVSKSRKSKNKRSAPTAAPQAEQPPSDNGPVITATNRTVLPPLQVEVVAGNHHRSLSPNNNSVKVDMDSSASDSAPPSPPAPAQADASLVSDASSQVTLPPATAERVSRSVKPEYPVLAKQMKVQGAVVLQALIDKGGKIEELHVVTGPSILANAAEEAVKQWRFKPYYQQGQAVETEARITVNFTISTY